MGDKLILVIDDDADVLDFCRTVLEAKGYRVNTAESGKLGLESVEKEEPDLIILDVIMESSDSGFQVAEKLGQDIPILMLTSIAGASEQVFDTSTLPVCDLVDKPIAPEALLKKVSKLLP